MSLPNYPKLKSEISDLLQLHIRLASEREATVLQGIQETQYHEGDSSDFATVDGDIKDLEPKEFAVEIEVKFEELPKLSHAQIIERVEGYGKQFGEQMAKGMFQSIGDSIEESGNKIDVNGPLTSEAFLKMIEAVDIDFDDQGNPRMPTLYVSSAQEPAIRKLMEEEESHKEAVEALMKRKKEDWIARESNRKLVD